MSNRCPSRWSAPLLALVFLTWAAGLAASAPETPAPANRTIDFARDVQPILAARCYSCHGPTLHQSGLRLDSKTHALQGGDSGPAIVTGKGSESALIRRVASKDLKVRMPPAGPRLTPAQIRLLKTWIDQGAVWPERKDEGGRMKDERNPSNPQSTIRNPQSAHPSRHWAFVPPKAPQVPAVKTRTWVRNPIDAFVLARLERLGIAPSPEADRSTLVRRLSLDLIGLPPTPAEVDRFVQDGSPDAYERLVDRLLASPHFGERWGRHWLDLARYADSDGYENDNLRPNAWQYRDWVIQAINQDLPFDQFTIHQLAGDLLWKEMGKQEVGNGEMRKWGNARSLISPFPHFPISYPDAVVATGFHRNSLSNSAGGADKEEFRVKAVKDRVNTTGSVWLGLTVGCAQCHTHKYDPILQREYYGLFAFFNNTEDVDVDGTGGKAQALVERGSPRESYVHLRGDFLRQGDPVQPHTPAFLPPLRPRGERPDRLDLARWIVDPDHPLTARVAVNHVWGHLFGQPLVATPDNFGKKGEKPTHPELLDWLAGYFVGGNGEMRKWGNEGAVSSFPHFPISSPRPWSRKALIRLIVTSATYRQSSRHRPELAATDPNNAILARQNRFRVEAEIVRDLTLAASGLLNPKIGGPSFQPPLPAGLARLPELKNERFVEATGGGARYRRGIYIHTQRTFPYPMLATFDGPDSNALCTRRDRSNTPLQALTLLNDPVFFECAQALGRRLLREVKGGREERIRYAFTLCVGRRPVEEEAAALDELLKHHQALYERDQAAAKQVTGAAPLPEGTSVWETAAWIGLARTLLNLEEFTTRE
jgi:mono/diheme cytochrome c family protein